MTDFENLYTSVEDTDDLNANLNILSSKVISPMLMDRCSQESKELHFVFLVHGYQGSSFDLSFLKDCMLFLSEDKVRLICSTVNDNDSSKCIDELGLNLASEVNDTLNGIDDPKKITK